MPKTEAFLQIEKVAVEGLRKSWASTVADAGSKLHKAIHAQDWNQSFDLVSKVSMVGLVTKNEHQLTELLTTASIFGAMQAGAVKGEVPQHLEVGLMQLREVIEVSGTNTLVKGLRDEVARAEREHKDQLYKAETSVLSIMRASSTAMMKTGVNLTMSRFACWGFLDQCQKSGIEEYAIDEALDKTPCPVCSFMHGKIFKVDREFSRVDQMLRTADPQAFRTSAPWPVAKDLDTLKAKPNAELQALGFGSPPYHPNCHGILVRTA